MRLLERCCFQWALNLYSAVHLVYYIFLFLFFLNDLRRLCVEYNVVLLLFFFSCYLFSRIVVSQLDMLLCWRCGFPNQSRNLQFLDYSCKAPNMRTMLKQHQFAFIPRAHSQNNNIYKKKNSFFSRAIFIHISFYHT